MKTSELNGKKCYNHLGGKLGAVLLEFLVREGWIVSRQETPNAYEVTDKGREGFRQMGLDLPDKLV